MKTICFRYKATDFIVPFKKYNVSDAAFNELNSIRADIEEFEIDETCEILPFERLPLINRKRSEERLQLLRIWKITFFDMKQNKNVIKYITFWAFDTVNGNYIIKDRLTKENITIKFENVLEIVEVLE